MHKNYLKYLPSYVEQIKQIKEIILTNVVLLGQCSCTPIKGDRKVNYPRVEVFLERMSEGPAELCAMDSFGNPYALIKGTDPTSPPIFLVAHMDTTFENKGECLLTVTRNAIVGPGLLDNSLGVGVLMSLPHIFKTLGVCFQSDIILYGLTESLGAANLKSIHQVLSSWKKPIRNAICLEGGEQGRLNYFSNSMIRAEVVCDIPKKIGWHFKEGVNAIVVINEVINRLLEIRLPQRPNTDIIIGRVRSGSRVGKTPLWANLGFEVHSESDKMVEDVYDQVDDICGNISHKSGVKLALNRLSNVKAAKITYHHPLVQSAMRVMECLDIAPRFESSESELSVFLSHNIPAITLGIAHGENYHKEDELVEIESVFKGVTQIVGVLAAVDLGECDEK